jgi:hypothetical protein
MNGAANAIRAACFPLLPGPADIARLKQHPNFAAAVHAAAGSMVDFYQGNRLLNALLNDRARVVFGMLVLDMHYAGTGGTPGFTAARARETCVAQRLCSAGRASAMIALMRFAGYIEPLPAAADRRLRLYGATERLLATHLDRWRRMFAAIAQVRPEGAAGQAALVRPQFAPLYVRLLADDFRAGTRIMLDSAPELGLFAERNCGLLLLFSLLADVPADATLSVQWARPVSISAMARRFSVSRAHVKKLMDDAVAAGFFAVDASNGFRLRFTPALAVATETFFATTFLYLADKIAAVVAALPDEKD